MERWAREKAAEEPWNALAASKTSSSGSGQGSSSGSGKGIYSTREEKRSIDEKK
jgi:hypothetical protein